MEKIHITLKLIKKSLKNRHIYQCIEGSRLLHKYIMRVIKDIRSGEKLCITDKMEVVSIIQELEKLCDEPLIYTGTDIEHIELLGRQVARCDIEFLKYTAL